MYQGLCGRWMAQVPLMGQDAHMNFSFVSIGECRSVEGVVVVIDVLRAFSFAAYALASGAERLILVDDLNEAKELASAMPGAIAGKDGPPAEGFDLLNSPGQVLERRDLHGKTIVHCTTSGTVGAVACRHAQHLYCASFVVAGATVERIRTIGPERVTFVITGDGGTAPEDAACAEYLAETLSRDVSPDPAPFLAQVALAGGRLERAVKLGHRGVHEDDVKLCMALNRFNFALQVVDKSGHLNLEAH
jgi:2-phosphosulfolactate phosphatase